MQNNSKHTLSDEHSHCDSCGACCTKMILEEEIEQYEKTFNKTFNELEVNIVCDNCYNKFLAWKRAMSN